MKAGRNVALIPAFNEEKTIENVVKKVKALKIKPVVIDDYSTDKTAEIAKKSGAVVLRQESNTGKGEAIKTGIKYTLKKLPKVRNIVLIDADMQYDPEEAPRLLNVLDNTDADIVIGYREWATVPLRHRFGNFIWRMSFNLLFGTRLKDTNCGFMAIKKSTAKKIMLALHGGYIIESSILSHAVKKKLKIDQVPVTVAYRSKSDLKRGLRMVGGIFLFILNEGLKYRSGKSKT
jgi:glycosyltransferase involved in cell wall biosynthesis